jgi:phosphatidate cytidylyltransferase
LNTNTKQRVISAVVILLLVCFSLSLGKSFTQFFAFLIGVLISDEILVNFLKLKRADSEYKFSQIFYFLLVTLFFAINDRGVSYFLLFLNLVQNFFLILFLFKNGRGTTLNLLRSLRTQQFLTSIFVFLPIHSMAFLLVLSDHNWLKALCGLILLVISADVSAWYVGKNFGKRKLWPSVSPKKTIEGALGAVVVTTILMSIYWKIFFGQFSFYYLFIFILLTLSSILGDLVQSKLKRRFSLKDSSHLIPGHGGIYDRSDSLLFAAPVYCLLILSL